MERANAADNIEEALRLLDTWGRGLSGTEKIEETEIPDAAKRNETVFEDKYERPPE